MKIEQIGNYINDYNKYNNTNFIIYSESNVHTFYYNGYNNGCYISNNIKEFKSFIDGYLKAYDTFVIKQEGISK